MERKSGRFQDQIWTFRNRTTASEVTPAGAFSPGGSSAGPRESWPNKTESISVTIGRNTSPFGCTGHKCGPIRRRPSLAQGPRSNGPPILLAAASTNQAVRCGRVGRDHSGLRFRPPFCLRLRLRLRLRRSLRTT
uniref:Uncharacterized protein n=1 Tax=Oryza punctata TaxID=4537 RepID=A0A0E0JV78_ORYPU